MNKGVIPGRYLYFEIQGGARGRVEISGPKAKVEFGSSSLEVLSLAPVSFYLIPPDCQEILEIVEVALTKDPMLKAAPGEPVRLSHLLEGEYELRDKEGATIEKIMVGPGETRITLKGR